MSYGTVTVTNSATLIIADNTKRRNLSIVNHGTTDIFIGPDSSVTSSNGLPLYSGVTRDQDRIPEGWQGPVYGITASGTSDVRYWETEGS
jgi:hypothetical protein